MFGMRKKPVKKSIPARIRDSLRMHMIRGLLLVVPLGVTAYVLYFCYSLTAAYLAPFIRKYLFTLPEYMIVPISVVLFCAFLYLAGLLARVYAGRKLIGLTEMLLRHIPLVKSIYGASKQVVEVISIQESGGNYQSALLVDFPRPGMKAFAFVTGKILVNGNQEYYKVFVPTTPNPTSGYFELVEPSLVAQSTLEMEDIVKSVVSAGILTPEVVDFAPVTANPDAPLLEEDSEDEEEEE
ncbi:MAG TPA: DUF502 domain-containing protein [Candidatus Hydrogenedentes bacterium]|nr:DUF502 domain-containing protein [Candidatus Hydrogenedentota bacterium]